MGRALAHGTTSESRFVDPTAFTLLPDEARARVEQIRKGEAPKSMRARLGYAYLERQSKVMVARTVAIDDAVRDAASPQLVILGAGLDGRAWRMPELSRVTVFEVDHPDSQRDKLARAATLTKFAADVRFVPVDFTRDSLDETLASAGHDPARATTWIWEGVVMYLTQADIEATLAVIERKSAAGSRLIVLYNTPAIMRRVVGLIVRRLGEPFLSHSTAREMRALLAKYGFTVTGDKDMHEIGLTMSGEIAQATRAVKHMRIAIGDRV